MALPERVPTRVVEAPKQTVGTKKSPRYSENARIAGLLLLFAVFATGIGLLVVFQKYQIREKYRLVGDLKQENEKLDIRILELRTKLQQLKSPSRMSSFLLKNGIDIESSNRVDFMDLSAVLGPAGYDQDKELRYRAGL
jgi:hypothetical protein